MRPTRHPNASRLLGAFPEVHQSYQFWILMGLSALIFVPVTLLTPPEPMDRLVQFYDAARPVGWWGPVRKEWERRQAGSEGGRRAPNAADRGRDARREVDAA